MQGTQVRSLVGELKFHCLGATKPMPRNYWAHAPQLEKPTPRNEEPVCRSGESHVLQLRPDAAQNK